MTLTREVVEELAWRQGYSPSPWKKREAWAPAFLLCTRRGCSAWARDDGGTVQVGRLDQPCTGEGAPSRSRP